MAKRRKKQPTTDAPAEAEGGVDPRAQPTTQRAGKATVTALGRELRRLDRELVASLNRRAEVAQQISAQIEPPEAACDPEAEAELLRRAVAENRGPLGDATVRAVFRELISGCRALQTSVRVAYLGPEFTFSHLAAIQRFGQSAELLPVGTIAAVFEEVERGQAQFGVVPMENSTDGRVSDTLDGFSRSRVRICGELPLRIHHCLLGHGRRDAIRTVYSKPQPLSQCRNWLAKHLPQALLHEVASTADAARQAAEDPTSAAVASAQAGVHYGLPVLAENIEDQADNVTRFAVISANPATRSGSDKTALMVEIAHQPGALADAMAIFKRNRLNMTWIESYPIPGSRGRYLFFIEFVGHQEELRARRAIASLRKKALRLEVLGSYAQAEPIG